MRYRLRLAYFRGFVGAVCLMQAGHFMRPAVVCEEVQTYWIRSISNRWKTVQRGIFHCHIGAVNLYGLIVVTEVLRTVFAGICNAGMG